MSHPVLFALLVLLYTSGGFDIPKQKCPPDRGSSDWVTDSLASMISPVPRSPFLSASPENTRNHVTASGFASAVAPRKIPGKPQSACDLPTPPLTPDDDDDDGSGASGIITRHSTDALDLLLNIFPRDGLRLLSFAKSVVVSAPNMGTSFDGVVLELPGKPKTLYVDGKNAPAVSLRERCDTFPYFILLLTKVHQCCCPARARR